MFSQFGNIIVLWIILSLFQSLQSQPVSIGGLFGEEMGSGGENAFRYAVNQVNNDDDLLPKSISIHDVQHLPTDNTFLASKKACDQAGRGVAAIFGSGNKDAGYIDSMCEALEIPHITVNPHQSYSHPNLFTFNLYPDQQQLATAFLHLVKHFKWDKFVVLYAEENDLVFLQDIIRFPANGFSDIMVQQVRHESMREILMDAQHYSFYFIVAHLNTELTSWFLHVAMQLGMVDPLHHFIITNLDTETIDLENYRYNNLNVTFCHLVNNQHRRLPDFLHHLNTCQPVSHGTSPLNNSCIIKTELALLFDAVQVFAHALKQVTLMTELQTDELSCEGNNTFTNGNTIRQHLKSIKLEGLTGEITFQHGRRMQFTLDILQLRPTGLKQVGRWHPRTGIISTAPFGGMFADRTLLVTTISEYPYMMVKKSDFELIGNDRFEGFCVDLLKEIAEITNLRFKIELAPDGHYGAPVWNGEWKWNGMVGQLIKKEVDLAVAGLTITYSREQVIDFTAPFMDLGITMLFKRPQSRKVSWFAFLDPFSTELWLCLITAFFGASLCIFVVGRFSPFEWHNFIPGTIDNNISKNDFTLSNSLWFMLGILMQQGSDIVPRAVSTRILGSTWCIFTLLMITSYTAKLVAFLTVETMISPIQSVEDLERQTKIEYGAVEEGSTLAFFRASEIPLYHRMWEYMDSREPSVLVRSTIEGIQRVRDGNYAFFAESTMVDYTVQRYCDLMKVGGLLNSRAYGIATQKGSPYRDQISLAILKLCDDGRMQSLKQKWWDFSRNCSDNIPAKSFKPKSLSIENVSGLYIILAAGLVLGIITAIIEFIWNFHQKKKCDKTIWTLMREELWSAIKSHNSTKKVLQRSTSVQPHPDVFTIEPQESTNEERGVQVHGLSSL